MGDDQRKPGSDLFIVDNSDADWKVRNYLTGWCGLASKLEVATPSYSSYRSYLSHAPPATIPDSIRFRRTFDLENTSIAAIDRTNARNNTLPATPLNLSALRACFAPSLRGFFLSLIAPRSSSVTL